MNCPKCESTDIEKTPLKLFLFLLFFGSACVFMFVGIFLPPLFALAVIMLLSSVVVFALPLPNYKCNQCNKAYKKKALTA